MFFDNASLPQVIGWKEYDHMIKGYESVLFYSERNTMSSCNDFRYIITRGAVDSAQFRIMYVLQPRSPLSFRLSVSFKRNWWHVAVVFSTRLPQRKILIQRVAWMGISSVDRNHMCQGRTVLFSSLRSRYEDFGSPSISRTGSCSSVASYQWQMLSYSFSFHV